MRSGESEGLLLSIFKINTNAYFFDFQSTAVFDKGAEPDLLLAQAIQKK
ncbi:MAG: hypothetical protein WCJ75_04500 [Desulfomonile sp.]